MSLHFIGTDFSNTKDRSVIIIAEIFNGVAGISCVLNPEEYQKLQENPENNLPFIDFTTLEERIEKRMRERENP